MLLLKFIAFIFSLVFTGVAFSSEDIPKWLQQEINGMRISLKSFVNLDTLQFREDFMTELVNCAKKNKPNFLPIKKEKTIPGKNHDSYLSVWIMFAGNTPTFKSVVNPRYHGADIKPFQTIGTCWSSSLEKFAKKLPTYKGNLIIEYYLQVIADNSANPYTDDDFYWLTHSENAKIQVIPVKISRKTGGEFKISVQNTGSKPITVRRSCASSDFEVEGRDLELRGFGGGCGASMPIPDILIAPEEKKIFTKRVFVTKSAGKSVKMRAVFPIHSGLNKAYSSWASFDIVD